jgi:hypothetical protein
MGVVGPVSADLPLTPDPAGRLVTLSFAIARPVHLPHLG